MSNKINSHLSFMLGNELFGLNVMKVINILEITKITEVPQSPDYMKGVINLRGEVLPVIDSRLKFGLPPIEITKNTCILVLNINIDDQEVRIGALVDNVQEVIEIQDEEILPAPSIGTQYKSKFIKGMYKNGEQTFIMLLDIDKIFSSDDLLVLQRADEVESLTALV